MKLTSVLAQQGNPEITIWCDTCQCRAIPLSNGKCGFCAPAKEPSPPKPRKQRPPKPAPTPKPDPLEADTRLGTAYRLIRDSGPLGAPDLIARLGWKQRTAYHAINNLRNAGAIKMVGRAPSDGPIPKKLYAVKENA